jgi:hypothetical protein
MNKLNPFSRLLKFLLTGLLFRLDEDGSAAVDRGDTLDAGAPEINPAAEADAAAEIARIQAEKDAAAAPAGEAEGEAEGETAAEKKKDSRIPLARHKELLEKERSQRAAVEAQLAQYQKGQAVAATNEKIADAEGKLSTLEASYTKLMADGELDKATAAMQQIRQLERSISDQKLEFSVAAAEARAVERVRYDTVVDRLEEAYPVLNPDSDDHDPDQVQDVLDLKAVYEKRGMTPSAALQKAAAKTFGAATAKQEKATTVTPQVDKDAVAAARKEAATKTAIAAAKATPASTKDVGLDSDKLGGGLTAANAMKMSQDDFAKLTEDQLAKLRGDLL